jgi:glycosyltransferase involved in cell wall biosynthesis
MKRGTKGGVLMKTLSRSKPIFMSICLVYNTSRQLKTTHEGPNKTKLLIVSDYFYPHWTGLAKSLYYFLEALDDEIQSTVLTVRFREDLPKNDMVFHTPIYRENPLFSFSRAKYSVSLLFRFFRLVNSHDAVFINSPNTNVFPLAILTKLFNKKLYIFHQGDLVLPQGILNRIIERVFDINSFLAFLLADKVSTYTQDYADHSRVLRSFLSKCSPVLFPLPQGFTQQKRKKHKGIIFGFAGRFVAEKGFDILLQAIPAIVASLPDARFLYAGEINMGYENFFEEHKLAYERVKDHVQLLGLLDEKALKDFYQSIDFLIVPSRSDCFNLVQAEAMRMGTPSLATDIPGLRFLVKKTGFGLLFHREDPESLAKTAIQAVREQATITACYSEVKKILNSEKIVQDLRTFFSEK